jgi:hypothetical protein
MVTSNEYTFGTDTEAIEYIFDAYERIGRYGSQLSGNDIDSAKRSIGFIYTDWANRQPNLWTIYQTSFALTQGLQSVTLTASDVYITEAFTRTTSNGINNDLMLSVMSRSEYAAIPNKAQQSNRPTQFYLQRSTIPICYLWPTPQDSSVTLYLNIARMVQDVGALSNTLDQPQRWANALTSELAVRLAEKWAPDRLDTLQRRSEIAYNAAAAEDSENVPLRIAPDMTMGRRG